MRVLLTELWGAFSKSSCVLRNPTVGLWVKLPNCRSHFIENLTLPFDKSKNKLHAIPHSSHLSAPPSALSITNFQIQTQENLSQIPKLAKGDKKKKNNKKKSIPCKLGFLKMQNKKKDQNIAKSFKCSLYPSSGGWIMEVWRRSWRVSSSKRTDEFLQALIDEQRRKEEEGNTIIDRMLSYALLWSNLPNLIIAFMSGWI